LIHKASHHFDILNWWAGGKPQLVNARGGTYFYGSNGPFRSTNCRNCEHTQACDFHIDLTTDKRADLLYLGAEGEDGYYRDGCLYAEDIDTEDQAAVFYNYDNGVQVVYSLIAYASYEGLLAVFEGTRGRLELEIVYPTAAMGDNRVTPGLDKLEGERLTRYSRDGVEQIDIPKVEGGHGGCDPSLLQEFIGQPWDSPRSNRMATLDEAIQAVIIGAAANASIAENGAPINAQDLLA
ncbi:MAG TPA: 4,5-dihydroxyphthalate dehydrogenase, partial [Lentisphaeria bacterium]|nr:4,5-dihydroxyphthalate dehydrogenase [Lentisphaeria bacterium]